MTTVLCVYKTGGKVYTPVYVEKLFESCKKYGAKKFLCLTDSNDIDSSIQTERLAHDWNGWWSKIELFRLPVDDQFLYFDLDTVINKDLTEILNAKYDSLAMLRDFYTGLPASGVMAWSKPFDNIYSEFKYEMDSQLYLRGGDQEYIRTKQSDIAFFQDLFPDQFVSYKWSKVDERLKASVICYHGKPKPHETNWSVS